ncbi:type IX secretion system periplasmic lipoprotein PorW/SprE [Pinibacter aurantiacus]|uniref:Tetratricopeptide repeat protein n=1 Tax=Pinibacter aurantiacus TaxID=2851599 RepID=A0A9E2W7L2_9BACT|nr:hypothetical protein [Pinibacter aurantiacus]MBV4356866.1 hypothetical protein [Pinibacter aurantiacus]
MFLSLKRFLFVTTLLLALAHAFAQPHLDPDIKKPKKFENRTLGAEKTETTKFKLPRKFIQNTVTHYNYYFNAATKLDQVLSRAKEMHKDDYSRLLPFYNYRLDRTATFKQDLDSVIYKSTAGILLHDLRNSYIDNLYLLIGQAYYFRNQLDSAHVTFQFVNFSFAPKEEGGYDKYIGSNANADEGGNAFSISTKENTQFAHRLWARPPSRNDALIWQIRTSIASNEYVEASSLILTLKRDSLFPKRLATDLNEMQAWNFYRQEIYDSSAFYLAKSLDNADNNEERSRWEYLLGQMYSMTNNKTLASQYYTESIKHTINPVQEVYARLNNARLANDSLHNPLAQAMQELLKMAKREKYLMYRDIVYYTASEVAQMQNDPENAKQLLLKSVHSSIDNPGQKAKSFLALGDISFKQKQYGEASRYYDSVNVSSLDPALGIEAQLKDRREALHVVVKQMDIIHRQDSLQYIAALPQKERDEVIRKVQRTLRRQQGLKDEEYTSGSVNTPGSNNAAVTDLFNTNTKGDWYFYNATQKTKGATEFKSVWGTRPNVDNWRRSAAIAGAVAQMNNGGQGADDAAKKNAAASAFSFESLLDKLPTTPEKLKISNDSIEHATFELGVGLQDYLEDYASAIEKYESLLQHFPQTVHEQDALFNLYYCYERLGITDKQMAIKRQLDSKYPNGKLAARLKNGGISADSLLKRDATTLYDDIYNKFIEGNFTEAAAEKKIADSKYGNKYWTPQLLYIEGVHYVHERDDSTARVVLNSILQLYPNSTMREKTQNLLSVLSRRREIEEYLTNLKIERPVEDTTAAIADAEPKKQQPQPEDFDIKEAKGKPNDVKLLNDKGRLDKTNINPNQQALASIDPGLLYLYEKDLSGKLIGGRADSTGRLNAAKPGVVVPGIVTGSRTIDSTLLYQYENQQKELAKQNINKETVDSSAIAKGNPIVAVPGLQSGQKIDSAKLNVIPLNEVKSAYSIDPRKPQFVALVMEKVDPVYVTEARNAFSRYNRDYYSGKTIGLSNVIIDENNKLLLFKGFASINEALDYLQKAKKAAPSEIIPWLSASKYSFILLSDDNLELLKNKKNIQEYKTFLQQSLPSQF